ncbi:MAG: hypothetical protein LAN36_15145 [Acidobacteriia bacterium]|nr:hypothetical protein [Terriglobia bacterium]
MKNRVSLGLSSIGESEFQTSRWERLSKIGLFGVVCVLLAVFFFYLIAQVQIGTAHATGADGSSAVSQ